MGQLEDEPIERWLFHGTNPRALEGIAKSNFDLSRAGSGAGGMYGAGIYCAECSSKADEYSEQDAGGVRGLLLCRAVLGNILYDCAKAPNVTVGKQLVHTANAFSAAKNSCIPNLSYITRENIEGVSDYCNVDLRPLFSVSG